MRHAWPRFSPSHRLPNPDREGRGLNSFFERETPQKRSQALQTYFFVLLR